MGIINNILPESLKPISRDIGFSINSIIYQLRCINITPTKNPIFILGNQKSGTSAIAYLLGKLTNNKTAIDLYYSGFHYSHFLKWKNQEITTSQFINTNRLDFSSKIIKEPHLSVFYNELKQEFTESKFIMIIRNPLDNIRSILDRLNIDGNKKNLDEEDKKKIFHSWNLLFNNTWIQGNRKQYIEVLAERWNIISEIFLENKNNMTLIKYEEFLENKTEKINELCDKMKLNKENDISKYLDIQFQPKGGKKEIDLIEFFGQENQEKIISICKNNMNKLGY